MSDSIATVDTCASVPVAEAELRVGLIELAQAAVRAADDGSIPMGDARRGVDRALRDAQTDLVELLRMPKDRR